MKVITDEAKIDEFLTRGVENIFPNADFLRARMKEGKPLTMYYGIDPTGPTIHLGHVVPILKLADWQKLGHKAIFLIGDFTAMTGDPTDKLAVRKKLSREEVLENARDYKKQASRLIDFDGVNKAELKYNSDWLAKMSYREVYELSALVSYQQMIERAMFQERIKKQKPIWMHELMYPMMQGYDSVAMDVDGEIGGNDQTFNMLMGRDLLKQLKNKEKFVIATKLLVDSTGKKMGKTEGNMLELRDTPENMFGKVMSWSDEMIDVGFKLCTRVLLEDVEEILKTSPRDAKIRLAKEVVSILVGEKEAEDAEKSWAQTFQKGELPENVREVVVERGREIREVLTQEGLVQSRSDFQRLVKEGAVEFNGEKVKEITITINESGTIKIGKHRFLKVVVT
ncbi:MAG TPA: tyrosine--tRNA ligase [Candidatus Paceibacterota bacterium]